VSAAVFEGNSTLGRYDDPLWVEQTLPPTPATILPRIADLIAAIFVGRVRHGPQIHQSPSPPIEVWMPSIEPISPGRPAPRVQRHIIELQRLTGWSERTLASIVGTSHPTIRAALAGSQGALTRSADVKERIDSLHAIVTRLAPLADQRQDAIVEALTSHPSGSTASAIDLVGSGKMAAAYLAAMEVLRPRRTSGMMQGSSPARPGQASVSLTD
jgi:hypothetical protein